MSLAYLPTPLADLERIEHTRLRRRMLYGEWESDAKARIAELFPENRAALHAKPDTSRCPLTRAAEVRGELLYAEPPKLKHRVVSQVAIMAEITESAGLWPMMQTVCRDTIGLRNMVLRVDARLLRDRSLELAFRPVFPDMVHVRTKRGNPNKIVEIRELHEWEFAGGTERWVYECWSIEDEDNPRHWVVAADGVDAGADISHLCGLDVGGARGKKYPCWKRTGVAYLPYVMYRAKLVGQAFDWRAESELVEGTLNVAVLWTQYRHCVLNAAWAQRYTMGAHAKVRKTVTLSGKTVYRRVPVDPSSVAELEPSITAQDNSMQPVIGQWASPTDPEKVAASIIVYERGLAEYAGLDPAELQRASGDPRSGYAIAISVAGKARQQRRFAPVFRLSDVELLCVVAARVNDAIGMPLLEEDGWNVEYIAADANIDPLTGEPVTPKSTEITVSKTQEPAARAA